MNYKLIDQYYDGYLEKEFIHNLTGLRTLLMEYEKVALHNQHHNEQIQQALER